MQSSARPQVRVIARGPSALSCRYEYMRQDSGTWDPGRRCFHVCILSSCLLQVSSLQKSMLPQNTCACTCACASGSSCAYARIRASACACAAHMSSALSWGFYTPWAWHVKHHRLGARAGEVLGCRAHGSGFQVFGLSGSGFQHVVYAFAPCDSTFTHLCLRLHKECSILRGGLGVFGLGALLCRDCQEDPESGTSRTSG